MKKKLYIIKYMFRLEASHQWQYKHWQRVFMRLTIRIIPSWATYAICAESPGVIWSKP